MNKDLAGEILASIYWCKKLRVKKGKWRVLIAKKFRDHNMFEQYTTEEFCNVWDNLRKLGLI